MKLYNDWDLIKYNLGGEKRIRVKINRIGHRLMDTLSYYIILSVCIYLKFGDNIIRIVRKESDDHHSCEDSVETGSEEECDGSS